MWVCAIITINNWLYIEHEKTISKQNKLCVLLAGMPIKTQELTKLTISSFDFSWQNTAQLNRLRSQHETTMQDVLKKYVPRNKKWCITQTPTNTLMPRYPSCFAPTIFMNQHIHSACLNSTYTCNLNTRNNTYPSTHYTNLHVA